MASVYDPLGFAVPFILVGKQILLVMCQDKVALLVMCQDKVAWDEQLRMTCDHNGNVGFQVYEACEFICQDSAMLSAISDEGCSALCAS